MTDTPDNHTLIEDAERARLALSPIRRQLLAALREPGSAASLADKLSMSRQKLGYHLRELEAAGLLRLVEERKRRGFTERVLVARAEAFIVDPSILGVAAEAEAQDKFAAGHLVAVAADVVREVTRMRGAAEAEGKRLLTLTIEADLGFSTPQELEVLTDRLSQAIAELARDFPPEGVRRRYRLVAGAHPAVKGRTPKSSN